MRIGKLDRPIRIEQKVTTPDSDYGGEVVSWVTHLECFACIEDITTKMQEQTRSDLRLLKRPCKVTTRYVPTIDATMRVVMLDRDNRILQIVSKPAELGRKEALEFMAEDYSE
jgi:SPP1 family predicted phage head-tail adaptor